MKKINETKICKFCGNEFHPNYGRPDQNFCSNQCYLQDRWGEKQSPTLCPICGKPNVSTGKRNQAFCSWDCAQKGKNGRKNPGRSNLITKICEWCGEKVTRPESNFHSEKVFCDYNCMAEWQSEFNTGESHPRWRGGAPRSYGIGWKRARLETVTRAQGICEKCKKNKVVHVHHKMPIRYFDSIHKAHKLSNLTALCVRCHSIEHRRLANSLPLLDLFLTIQR